MLVRLPGGHDRAAVAALDHDAVACGGEGQVLEWLRAAHPAIRAAVAAAVQEANGRLSRVEQVKRYAIVPVFWEPGGEEITPTMKLKRGPVAARYADVIDSLSAEAEPVRAGKASGP